VLCVIGLAACALLLPKFVSYDAEEFRKTQAAGGTTIN
jgi:hypothetical protein